MSAEERSQMNRIPREGIRLQSSGPEKPRNGAEPKLRNGAEPKPRNGAEHDDPDPDGAPANAAPAPPRLTEAEAVGFHNLEEKTKTKPNCRIIPFPSSKSRPAAARGFQLPKAA